jgi:mannobiose 2-epimerase
MFAALALASPVRGAALDLAAAGLPSKELLSRDRALLEKMLKENLLPFWLPGTLDTEHGGYRLNHDGAGTYQGPADKHLVTQARNVWFFARLSMAKHGGEEHLRAARHGYEFLKDRLWDKESGGFYWAVSADGTEPTKPEKHLYGQSFGLYALAEYGVAAGDRAALDLARELFGLLEAKAHDPIYGGYRESFRRDWSPAPPDAMTYMAVPAGVKLMNTHLHLMEALTAFYRATGDPLVKERLTELLLIQSNAVVRKDLGACTDKYRPDWTPLRGPEYDRISYGHDIENVWLLMDAAQALGISAWTLADCYRTLFDYSLRHGFDAERGGFFNAGPIGGPADRREKVWWVQAECLVSALRMFNLTGDRVYYDCFAKTLGWIDKHQVDWEKGDWHAEISAEGQPSGQKAGPWKSAYHNGRAILESMAVLDGLIGS